MKTISKRRIVFYIAVVASAIFLYFLGFLRPVETVVSNVFNPVYSVFFEWGSDIKTTFNNQMSKRDLFEENKKLKAQVNDLQKENIDLNILREENGILRDHLRFSLVNKTKYVMAKVISRGDALNISDRVETIVINKGKRDGIYPGLSVVSGKGAIVGKVEEVKANTSKVYLTNNKKCKLTATISGSDADTSGITEGDLGLTVKMDFIPQQAKVEKGDIVITSGLEETIPRGLLIGKVVEVNKESDELWQTATVESAVQLKDLIIVAVLLP